MKKQRQGRAPVSHRAATGKQMAHFFSNVSDQALPLRIFSKIFTPATTRKGPQPRSGLVAPNRNSIKNGTEVATLAVDHVAGRAGGHRAVMEQILAALGGRRISDHS
jgi:hypothetical protein